MANKTLVYRCQQPDCGVTTDHLHQTALLVDGEWHDNIEAPATVSCRRCGHPSSPTVAAPAFRIARGRHRDSAVGKVFNSEAEANDWYKANGVTSEPASHHLDYLARRDAEQRLQIEREEKEWNEYQDKLRYAPEHADYRQQVANGFFHDKAVESLRSAGVAATTDDIHVATGLEGASP